MPPIERDRSRKGGTRGDAGRADRLAAELRENLKRRKARARAAEAAEPTQSQSQPPAGATDETGER